MDRLPAATHLGYPSANGKTGWRFAGDRRSGALGPLLAEVGLEQSRRSWIHPPGTALAHGQRDLAQRHGETIARPARQNRVLDEAWCGNNYPWPATAPEPEGWAGRTVFLQWWRRRSVRVEPFRNGRPSQPRLGEHGHSHVVRHSRSPSWPGRSYFYMDDVSLEVIEEPPLVISTPLDEYYVGETIPWTANATTTNGTLAVTLLSGERRMGEQTLPARPARCVAHLKPAGSNPASIRYRPGSAPRRRKLRKPPTAGHRCSRSVWLVRNPEESLHEPLVEIPVSAVALASFLFRSPLTARSRGSTTFSTSPALSC